MKPLEWSGIPKSAPNLVISSDVDGIDGEADDAVIVVVIVGLSVKQLSLISATSNYT